MADKNKEDNYYTSKQEYPSVARLMSDLDLVGLTGKKREIIKKSEKDRKKNKDEKEY